MKRLAFVGAAFALLVAATVTVAASPAASPTATPKSSPAATAKPTASPSPSATPAPAASPAPGTTTTVPAEQNPTWSASVAPVDITGGATVVKNSNGTGTLTLKLTGMVDEATWKVDVQAGTIEMPSQRVRIALKQGDDVTKVAPDTIKVDLTKSEMKAFVKAQKSTGVVVFVSDGTRLSAATFSNQ
jgi:hypothetical protein